MTKHPIKIFPCDCGSEGLGVRCCGEYATLEEDQDLKEFDGAPFISIAFWQHETKLTGGNKLSLWERIRYAWQILRGKPGWSDMVCFRSNIARNFANHILYLLAKHKKKGNGKDLLVKQDDPDGRTS